MPCGLSSYVPEGQSGTERLHSQRESHFRSSSLNKTPLAPLNQALTPDHVLVVSCRPSLQQHTSRHNVRPEGFQHRSHGHCRLLAVHADSQREPAMGWRLRLLLQPHRHRRRTLREGGPSDLEPESPASVDDIFGDGVHLDQLLRSPDGRGVRVECCDRRRLLRVFDLEGSRNRRALPCLVLPLAVLDHCPVSVHLPSVCLSEFYRNGWTDRARFDVDTSSDLSYASCLVSSRPRSLTCLSQVGVLSKRLDGSCSFWHERLL